MTDTLILNLDAQEISDTDADFHTLAVAVDEPMVRMLERYEVFNREEEASVVKVIPGQLDDEPEHISLETLADGTFSLEMEKHITKLWPVIIQSTANIKIDQVITAFYAAHRLNLSHGYVPREGCKIFLFGEGTLDDQVRSDIQNHMNDPDEADLFFEAKADLVIRERKKD